MEFVRRAAGKVKSLGILAGTFNPPTRAHRALASAALDVVDEVLFVLPRMFPHKAYEGARFEERLEMLARALADEPRFSIAATEKGLFIDIAREARGCYGAETELHFLCGRDAAERIVNWDYGKGDAIERQLCEYGLLVAPRQGVFLPPEALRGGIRGLEMRCDYSEVSATEVRERIRRGEVWEELVAVEIVEMVRGIYGEKTR